jgi:hypothetical protein
MTFLERMYQVASTALAVAGHRSSHEASACAAFGFPHSTCGAPAHPLPATAPGPDCLPLFTSDGLNMYFSALTAHFGHWLTGSRRGRFVRQWKVAAGLIYGQVKKCYRRRKLVRVTHMMRLGTQVDLTLGLQGLGFSGRLNTAFIERVNLTVRQGVASLARRTWATAQQSTHLLASLEWWRAYYHFVRPHEALRVALVQPQQRGVSV